MRFAWLCLFVPLWAQEWRYYGGDAGGRKHSPLKQINRANVTQLRPAWTFHTGEISDGTTYATRSAFETTPLMIEGVLYLTTPFNRLVALDPDTGRQMWSHDPQLDRQRNYTLFCHRGAAYWSHGRKRRLLYGTEDGRLFSVDAANGQADPAFGTNGFVNLRAGVADEYPDRGYGMTSPPAVFANLVITGSWASDGEARGPRGDVRAFDVETGRLVWTFHTVPRVGEFGYDTWAPGSAEGRGGANAWSILSVDEKRGIVYVPLTSPSTDFYGGDRRGAGLFGDALVALDARTGRRLWHFQSVHHNIWDYDLPAQPMLLDLRVPAVAQITKTGFVFVFNRTNGQPLFPIEERPVPSSEVPGEAAWPTQPFAAKLPAFARQSMRREELGHVTPDSRAFCEGLVKDAVFGQLFTPIGLKPTVLFPGTDGGANWGGGSFDPETQTLYVNSRDVGMVYRLEEREGAAIPYRARGPGTPNSRFWAPGMIPCQQPPWGHLTAYDLRKGEIKWRSVLGVVDSLVERGLPPTGAPNLGGSLATAGGLVFIGATNDSRFRAFDAATGRELWVTRLPASAHATPMTYRSAKSGKQYVVIAAGGGHKYNTTFSDALVAFALP
jgi:quinoprotein glucose dehydrogenase